MAQFRTDKNIIDSGQVFTRYEVMMLSDQLTPSGSIIDAFGRLRTSDPFTVFDSQMIGHEGNRFNTSNTANGIATFDSANSCMNMTVTTGATDTVIRQSRRYMPYQPGKSLLILNTFAMANPTANVIQRVGYFDANNGIFLENSNTTNYLVVRNNGVDIKVPQEHWNVDKFDGTGYSSQKGDQVAHKNGIDVSKTNIFWIDIEWLGVGDVRAGFIVDGVPHLAHVFHNDNRNLNVYMRSACLPVRYEIRKTGITATGSTMKQICSSVISEGGFQAKSVLAGISRGFTIAQATDLGLAGTEVPLISIRVRADRPNSIVIPHASHIYVDSNQSVSYRWLRNVQTLNGTWVQSAATGSSVEYNITSDSTGFVVGTGQVIQGGFATAGLAAVAGGLDNYDYQLGRNIDGTSETFTLTAIGMNNNTKVLSKLDWFQIV